MVKRPAVDRLAAISACMAFVFFTYGRASAPRYAALVDALPPARTVEAPLSGIPYRPLGAHARAVTAERAALFQAAAEILDEARARPAVETLHAAGVAQAILGAPREAVISLESALFSETGETQVDRAVQRSRNAALLQDLAAVLISHAGNNPASPDLSTALGAANRAISLGADARFTRALILERLELRDDAIRAWNDLLVAGASGSSQWQTEGRVRLETLIARRRAARAAVDIGALRSGVEEQRYGEAMRELREAGRLFQQNDFRAALERTAAMDGDLATRYPAVYLRARWLAGICRLAMYRPVEAIRDYEAALDVATRLHDGESVAALETLLAEACRYSGDADRAADLRRRALRDAYRVDQPARLQIALSEAADAATREGRIDEAKAHVERLIVVSRRLADPSFMVDALVRQAFLFAATGDRPAGQTALSEAARWLARIDNAEVRRRMGALTGIASAAVTGVTDRASLDAIAFYGSTGNGFGLSDALALRGRLLADRNELAAARTTLENALDVAQSESAHIVDPAARSTFLERRQTVFDDLVDVAFRSSQWKDALQFAELSHRGQLDAGSAVSTVPPRVTAIEYFVGRNDVYAWVLTGTFVRPFRLSIKPAELKELAGDRRSTAALRRLYIALIEPVASVLPAGATLAFIPDKELQSVPFSALMDRRGRYLLERFRVVVVPSIASLSDRPRVPRRTGPPRALVVSGSLASGSTFLPMASMESKRIAGLYQKPVVLAGAKAQAGAVLREAETATIIHIAAHATANPQHPSLSSILLGDAQSLSVLYARDISTSRMRGEPTVFLNACSTAEGSRRVGMTSLAQAFLAAGASEVVATLWPIEDDTAFAFAAEFHKRLRDGATAVDALRALQLASIQSKDPSTRHPATWAAYEIVGWK